MEHSTIHDSSPIIAVGLDSRNFVIDGFIFGVFDFACSDTVNKRGGSGKVIKGHSRLDMIHKLINSLSANIGTLV
jgi:hypothetical protein